MRSRRTTSRHQRPTGRAYLMRFYLCAFVACASLLLPLASRGEQVDGPETEGLVERLKGWILTDAGWMAMSRDRGTATQDVDQGYGMVCDADARPIEGLVVSGANQEHGIISSRGKTPIDLSQFPIGTRLRILPNHACATAAQYDAYHVLANDGTVHARWPRFGGW